MAKTAYYRRIIEKMDSLEIGESFDRKELILKLWGDFDYYIEVSFNSIMPRCRQSLEPKIFKTIEKRIVRLS